MFKTLLEKITGKPRYKVTDGVDFEWSKESLVHNLFRVYELIFGRRVGIKVEMSTIPKDGRTYYYCHSIESIFALSETLIRNFIKGLTPDFSKVRIFVPVFQTNSGFPMVQNPFLFAIAFDAAASGSGGISTTNTWSHTCTGSNLTLTVSSFILAGGQPTATATYNSISMTEGADNTAVGSDRIYIWYLPSPSTGANNVVVTSLSAKNAGGSISMSGTAASPEGATNTATGTSNAPSISVTTGSNNSMLVDAVFLNDTVANQSPTTSGSNQTSRYQQTEPIGGEALIGSTKTTTTAGSYTSSWSISGSIFWGSSIMEIKPLAAPSQNSNFLLFF